MDVFDLFGKVTLNSNVEEQLSKDEGLMSSFGGKVGSLLGTAAKVGGAAIGAATTAVGAFAKESMSVGNTFNSAMSQVAATMGNVDDMSEESLNKLKEYASGLGVAFDDSTSATELSSAALRAFAQEMGSTTAFSASQAADALNYMALAGYDATTSMDMLPNVLNLAAAGNMDLARASDMVTDTQSALGLSLDETSAMVDQMAKASSKSNTSVAQLGEAMLTIGATARGVKGGTVELSTVLGVLADNGIKASEGGTHLRNAILSLQTPTKDGVEALAKLGMTYQDMYDEAGNMRSLPEIFLQMQSAMEGMNQQSKDAIISGIFNKTDLAAINALVGTSADRWDELSGAIENSAGAAEAMAGTQLDNLEGSMVKFQSALEGAQILLSDQLTPTFNEFVKLGTDSISDLTKAFKEGGFSGLMDQLDDVMVKLIAKVAEIAPMFIQAGFGLLSALATGIVKNIPVIAKSLMDALQSILAEISNAILGYNMFDDLSSFGDAIIQILSEKIPDLYAKGVEWVKNLFQGFTNGDVISENISFLFEAFLTGLSEGLPKMLEKGIEFITFIVNGMLESYPVMISTMSDLLNQLVAFIMENLPLFLEKGIELIGNIVAGIQQNLPAIIDAIINMVTSLIATIQDHLPEFLSKGKELLGHIISGIAEKLPEFISSMAELSAQALANIGEHLPEFLQKGIELVGQLVAGLIRSIPDVLSWVGDMFNDVVKAFSEYDWLSIGANIVSGIIDGLLGGLGAIWDAGVDVASNLFDAACDFLDIHSPSRKGRYIARMFNTGIAEDLISSAPVDEAISAVESVYDAAKGAVDDFEIPMVTSMESSTMSDSAGSTGANAAILQLLTRYLPLLANMQVVLQDRTVAGKLAPIINEELGALAEWEAVL